MNIKTIEESERGCGYRKPGGIYLIGNSTFSECGMLPIPLEVCPCCNQGIKPCRGFGWISTDIWKGKKCDKGGICINNNACYPFRESSIETVGIMWVGSKFYPSSRVFLEESIAQGVSKRIAQIPKDLVIGQTWVMLAHRKPKPHIFACFIPTEIQYVVRETDSEQALEAMEKRGITPVRVKYKPRPMKKGENYELFKEQQDDI